MRSKQERLDAIRQVIEARDISTQEELIAELEKLGHEVTQATVSRDIGELGLLKVKVVNSSRGRQVYSLPEIERLRSMLSEFMISIDRAGNLIVVKTTPGTAQAVASAIDAAKWADVLGTVGGDDTVLIITRDENVGSYIVGRLMRLSKEKTV